MNKFSYEFPDYICPAPQLDSRYGSVQNECSRDHIHGCHGENADFAAELDWALPFYPPEFVVFESTSATHVARPLVFRIISGCGTIVPRLDA